MTFHRPPYDNFDVNLLVIGFNYKKTPLALRETMALDRERSIKLGRALASQEVIGECLVLSTCNRTEVYAIGPCLDGVRETIYQTLCEMTKKTVPELTSSSYCLSNEDALIHLFRVASSLDAMVVGETQILGQLKAAYQAAAEYDSVGPYLHRACHLAFRVAKKIRTETSIASLPVSVGTLSVELIENTVGDLGNKNVLVIGAGEMSSLVSAHLAKRGAKHLWITNRSQAPAETLALASGAIIVPFKSWNAHLMTADVVISSISGGIFVKQSHVERALAGRAHTKLVLLDLAIPRNIEEGVSNIAGATLFNIDDLQRLADKNLAARKISADKAEAIAVSEAKHAFEELHHIKLAPLLCTLQKKCTSIIRAELDRLFANHSNFTDEEKESVSRCAESIVKKILHDPISQAKEELARPHIHDATAKTLLKIILNMGNNEIA